MFLGHYALALGAKRENPRSSLGMLFAAAQLPDLLWPIFLILGWERIAPGDHGFTSVSFTYYPWSHSLLLVIGWGILAAVFASPAPSNLGAVGWMALAGWLIPVWAWWADAHRRVLGRSDPLTVRRTGDLP